MVSPAGVPFDDVLYDEVLRDEGAFTEVRSPVVQAGAYLQESVTGRVYLHVKDYNYAPDDPLPAALFPPDATPLAGKARHYVSTCMIVEYGRDESRWPSLARKFVRDEPD